MIGLSGILALAAGLYAIRVAGLLASRAQLPVAWERALSGLPVATLTALVVVGLTGRPDEAAWRWPAAIGAGMIAVRWPRMEICILAGMALYWLLRTAL